MKDDLINKVQQDVWKEQKHRDGIPQIVAGLFLIFTMLSMMAGNNSMFVVFIPLMPIGIEALRKRITYPRIGYAQVREETKERRILIWAVLGVVIALGFVFVLVQKKGAAGFKTVHLYNYAVYGIALLVVTLSVFVFVKRRSYQFIWYAAAILVFAAAVLIFKLPKTAVFYIVLAFGAAHIAVGAYNLATFIKKYPVIKDE